MANITLRGTKGSALSHAEMDGNFFEINSEIQRRSFVDENGIFMVIPSMVIEGVCSGNTAETATQINTSYFRIGYGNCVPGVSDGLRLPENVPSGTFIMISNDSSETCQIYPPLSGQIDYSGINVPKTIATWSMARCICHDSSSGLWRIYY